MCGIFGEFVWQDRPTDMAILKGLVSLMERRGPDDEGIWTDGQCCTLGFRRLSILDLTPAGHQPMLTQDGRFVLVYNGEVYNFKALRQGLEREGVRFRSTGDAEVVLYALALWGKRALELFNGMFALGLYDVREKRLLLARDHAGIKPLYYMLRPGGLVFASQYDQILAHPWSRDLNVSPDALALYLRLGYIPAPYALLNQTYMLEPGTWLEVGSDGRVLHGRFFEFPTFQVPDLFGEAALEAVDGAVTEAVRRHLVSDVPVGVFLSGGIDSPLVAAKMRAVSGGPVKAFTIGTEEDRFDESPDATRYAEEMGLLHFVERITPEQAVQMLEDVIAACGEPFADHSIFPTMLVSRLARRYVKVVLSGDGGDELFWGYTQRFCPLIQKAEDFQQPYWWRMIRWGMRRFLHFGNGYWNLRQPTLGHWYRTIHTRFPEHLLRAVFPEVPPWPENFCLFLYSGGDVDHTAQWLRWNEFVGHLTMVLLKVDRASMYHSLEVRVPLLDKEVVQLAARVNWQSCLDLESGIGKLPLRWVLSRHVQYQTKVKRGFSVPIGTWLSNALRPVFEEKVLQRQEILGLPLNREALRTMFRQHVLGQRNFEGPLWLLLSLSLWREKHFASRSPVFSAPQKLQVDLSR
jgi:asparagine synthase (glutamine-hydrolysing)